MNNDASMSAIDKILDEYIAGDISQIRALSRIAEVVGRNTAYKRNTAA